MKTLALVVMTLVLPLAVSAGQSDAKPDPTVFPVTQRGHSGAVVSGAFPLGGRVFATASSDGSAKLWSTATGALLRTLPGYEGGTLRLRGDGSLLLAGPDSPNISGADSGGLLFTSQLWDVPNAALLLDAAMIAVTEDGALAAVAETKGDGVAMRLRLVEPRSKRVVRELPWKEDSASFLLFSPDGRRLAVGGSRSVTLFDVSAASPPTRIPLAAGPKLYEARFSADGSKLVVATEEGIALVDAATRRVRPFPFSGVSLASDGKIFVSHVDDAPMSIVDAASGRRLGTIPVTSYYAMNLSPDGGVLIVRTGEDRRIEAWDTRAFARLWSLPSAFVRDFDATGERVIVSTEGSSAELRDSRTGEVVGALSLPAGWSAAAGVWFDPNGRFVGAADRSAGIAVFDASTGAVRTSFPATRDWVTAAAVSADGRSLATAHGRAVRLWDLRSGVPSGGVTLPETEDDSGEIASLAFGPKGERLAIETGASTAIWSFEENGPKGSLGTEYVESRDGALYAHQVERGIEVRDARDGRVVRAFGEEYTAPLIFDPSGTSVFVQNLNAPGANGSNVERVDLATGRTLATYPALVGTFGEGAVSPDGRLLALSFGDARLTFSVAVYDVATGRMLGRLDAADPKLGANGTYSLPAVVAFSPDGSTLAVGNADSGVELWDARTLARARTLRGHTGLVWSIAFTPDSKTAITASVDATTRFWSVETGEALCTVTIAPDGEWMAVSPSGLFDGSPGGWGQTLWASSADLFDVSPAEAFFNEFYSPGLLADVAAGRRPRAPRAIERIDRRQPVVSIRRAGGDAAGEISTRTADLEIEVRAGRPGGAAKDVRLFRNGALVRTWRGDALGGGGSATLRAEKVPVVAGENVFTAYAFNGDDVKSATARLGLSGAPSLARAGRLYVLTVGVDHYSNSSFDLRFAAADADAFGEAVALGQASLGEASPFAEIVRVPLRDAEATSRNVELALRRLGGSVELPSDAPPSLAALRPAEPEDAVAIFFAGHGVAFEQRFYLVTHDLAFGGARSAIDAAGIRAITSNAISDRDLEAALEPIDARAILLVVDACNSGQALESSESRRGPMNTPGLAQLAYEKGMYVLTAAQSYQAALEARKFGHGLLTYALVEEGIAKRAADREPADGVLRLSEWFDYAVERVPGLQSRMMKDARILEHTEVAFVEGEEKKAPEDRSVQRPRAFAPRDAGGRSVVVARFP